jgi:hypothetical protein
MNSKPGAPLVLSPSSQYGEVRGPQEIGEASATYKAPGSLLTHPSNRVVAQLNERWRVVDDPLQWILQSRKGNARFKSSGWRSRSFCRTLEGLLRCIREYCCLPDHGQRRCIREYRGVDEAALKSVLKLPEWHVDR